MKLIPKYQNAGLVTRQDNTYVAKPTIPPKLIKRTYTPTQSYVSQDNRSEWQREQGSKKADEEYKKYVEDKKMQQGLENLNGFLNFVDAATITTGVGKGLSLIGKSVGKQIAKGMVSREFRRQSRNLPTPSNILPNNIGWGPKQSIHVVLTLLANYNYIIRKDGMLFMRMPQLKDYYGLDDPNQEITEDMLRYAAENYVKDTKLDNNMGLFFKSITDWKEAAKWLSKYATVAGVPITINNKTNDYDSNSRRLGKKKC